MTDFDWKRDVPTWVVLRFIQMKEAFTAGGAPDKSIYMTSWKATPKGGKLGYIATERGAVLESTVQLYK